MSHILAVSFPKSDIGFRERVQQVVAREQGAVDSVAGVARMQAVLRANYPSATVASHGVSTGNLRRTIALDVYRDGPPGAATLLAAWTEAVYDRGGASAYRAAVRVLGEGSAAESVVEGAFQEVLTWASADVSVEEGVAAVKAAASRRANEVAAAELCPPTPGPDADTVARPALAATSFGIAGARRSLGGPAVGSLLSIQREALELSVLEDLKVSEIAERMRTTAAAVHSIFRDALLAVGSGVRPSAATTLGRWREAERGWAELPQHHPARPERSAAVAHAWLDYQVASRAVAPETIVLVTDTERRFIAASANAGQTLGRPSVVGLRIDDVTAAYAKPLVPELWTLFDTNGGMQGEYDCDRPNQLPIRTEFRGVWGRPLPDLAVGYLQPPLTVQLG